MSEWARWLMAGLLSIALGALALGNAVAVSIGIVWVTGSMLLLAGGVQMVLGFSDNGLGNKALSMLLGLLIAVLGLSFMRNPLEGTMSITAVITLVIAFAGVLRLFWAFRMRQTGYYWMMLISGSLSILLAGFILANFLQTSERLLGILLGIELVFNGAALSVLALFLRAHTDEY
ncbi:HdeD family acid-resistance protein [Aliiruegeria sabulilitoris]|uniref:HdeD family acid-resistance protein n=1 Tax=Aliiruegeria sabulilitoris TaxID=1510458 RepID=UPI00082CF894|nr:DUF308 domain-containing protein [Aliiruegeria sabulilitoris]NDR57808.1 hypothetical protein [Pseudoruegeria sp. M32A2M]